MFAVALLAPATETPLHKLVTRSLQSTVQVQANLDSHYDEGITDDGQPMPDEYKMDKSVCSGFVAYSKGSYSVIVTAKHCAQPQELDFMGISVGTTKITPSSILFSDGDKAQVGTIWLSKKYDLAVITVHSHHQHPSVSIHEGIDRTEPLFVLGMPLGESWSYSAADSMQGAAKSYAPDGFDDTYLIDCPACAPGDSGGPVFNMHGQVVGDLEAGSEERSLSMMVPAKYILTVLKEFH